MDGYDSVIISLGDGPGALNGRGKSDKIKEIADEIDRLYRMESAMKEILEWRSKMVKKYLTKPDGTPREAWQEWYISEIEALDSIQEVFDAIVDL